MRKQTNTYCIKSFESETHYEHEFLLDGAEIAHVQYEKNKKSAKTSLKEAVNYFVDLLSFPQEWGKDE